MKKQTIIIITGLAIGVLAACDGGHEEKKTSEPIPSSYGEPKKTTREADPKGIGEVKEVTLTDPLNAEMINKGKAIYEMKCSSCHKLTDQRVVGPGWAGITNKRRPEWIMNMITNVNVMLDQDPTAQKLLEECLTRMPNQGLSIGDARDILEYMRQNDLDQVKEKDKAANS